MRGRITISAALILSAAATVAAAMNELVRLAWLEGTWKRDTSRGTRYETWQLLSASTMEGHSWSVAKVDGARRPLESLLLVHMSGELFYIPKVAENPFPVPFKLTSLSDEKATFENPGHDFPTTITYWHTSDDSMTVRVEGPGDGDEPRHIDFHFERVD